MNIPSKTPKKVEVLEYNPEWKEWFQELKREIWPAVAEFADSIEHVGSTSVEGMCAKPRIDIDIIVRDQEAFQLCIEPLESIGYEHRGIMGVPGREAFRKRSSNFSHNLYVCVDGCDALQNHLLLRKHLRASPDARRRYSELKLNLAKKFPENIDAYSEAKSALILEFLRAEGFSERTLQEIEDINRAP